MRKNDFTILNREVNGHPLTYLDSAATSQTPLQVINAVADFEKSHRANVHRAVHTLSMEATELFDLARANIANFIGVSDPAEIIFTKGATESINLVAYAWGEENISEGDVIVATISEHHANFVPWQQLVKRKKAELRIIEVGKDGILLLDDLDQKLKGAKLLALTHASNVLGTINPVRKIADSAHRAGALVIVDGAQALPHVATDVHDLGADFYAFSGHKMLGPTGIGVLWAKRELLEKMKPFNYGGSMIKEVTIENSEWNDLPDKFEAGTPNISGAIGLSAAIDYLKALGMDKVREHEIDLLTKALPALDELGVSILGSKIAELKTGVISFDVPGAHPHDVAEILNSVGIAVRTGHHCAMPLHTALGYGASSRASFYLYNDKNDVDRLVEGIKEVKKVFR